MDANTSLKRLIHVLSERDIGLGKDDLDWLFESPETRDDMVAWVNEYLNEHTLLSREELELYVSIITMLSPRHVLIARRYSQSSQDPFYRGSELQEGASTRPLDHLDFENSIKALEDSTAAIDRQCTTLEVQLKAMREIQNQNRLSSPEQSPKIGFQPRPREVTQPEIEVDKLADDLHERTADLQHVTNGTLASLKTGAQRQLDKDDRLLEGLQKLMLKIETPESQGEQIVEIEDLSRALVSLQGTVVKNRANQVYLSALDEETGHQHHYAGTEVESAALENELDGLIGEVDTVLEMVIDYQHRRPLLESLRQRDAEAHETRQSWLSYVRATLEQMTTRLHEIFRTTQDLDVYGDALSVVSKALDEASKPQRGADTERPLPQTHSSYKAVQQSVLPATSDVHPAVNLLRHHGIRPPASSSKEGLTKATIEAAISERKARLAGLSKSTTEGISNHVTESVGAADAQLQGLLDAVYAYSPYATVSLVDPEFKARLQNLDKDVEVLAGELRKVSLENLIEREKNQVTCVLHEDDASTT